MMKKLKLEELERMDQETFKNAEKSNIVVLLDNVRSALNIGSAFRTADAFRIEQICLCGLCAKPPHKEISKTAIGATHSMDWIYMDNTLKAIKHYKDKGYRIIAVEQVLESTMLHQADFKPNEKIVLVFGNEVMGVDQKVMDMVDGCIEIKQFGTKHSLNISVSIGITLWKVHQMISPDWYEN